MVHFLAKTCIKICRHLKYEIHTRRFLELLSKIITKNVNNINSNLFLYITYKI